MTESDPRVGQALTELRDLIRRRWPAATFRIARGEDEPDMVHLWATVDVEDTDEVVDAVIDRLVELQVDEGLPISVIPVRPLERVLRGLEEQRRHGAQPVTAGDALNL